MKLDVTKWEEFTIGDLFRIETTKGKTIDDLTTGSKIPYIAAKHDENGLTMMCDYEANINYISDGNCIIFIQLGEGSSGYANYINEQFIGMSGKTCCGYIDNIMNPEIGAFLTVILCQEKPKYSYGRSWTGDRLSKTIIKLPTQHNPDGTPFIDPDKKYSEQGYVPDWQFMEDYIKALHHKPLTTQNKTGCAPELKTNEWCEFKIARTNNQSGLFKIENCKCGSAGNLDDGNDIKYIGAKKADNGVMKIVAHTPELTSKGHGIMFICDGEGSVGYTNYMHEDFIGSTTTAIGYDENLTEPNAMFLVTVLDCEKFKYSYGRKYRTHLNEIIIKLPIQHNPDGTPFIDPDKKYSEQGYVPDWQFMEDYIKALPYGDRL